MDASRNFRLHYHAKYPETVSFMIEMIARVLPASLLRFFGRLQYRVPVLGPLIRRAAGRIAAKEGTIQRGVGAGLKFRTDVPVAGYRLGTTEPEIQQALLKYLKKGDVVYDVGANVGFYSVLSAHIVGPEGHVYAFEPFSESAATARHNLALNGFTNATVIEEAVADVTGTEWFEMDTSPVTFKLGEDRGDKGMNVPVTTIDDFLECRDVRPPDFIKLDVEGAEKRALLGLKATLGSHHPTVLCEVHYAVTNFQQFVVEELGPLGYRIRNLDGGPIPTGDARFQVLIEHKET